MGYKWTPSKTKAREFYKKLDEVQDYCDNNGINYSGSMDSYYFAHDGKKYRVSNHTVDASNAGAYRFGEQVRDKYHTTGAYDVQITAGKTRIIEIHKAIMAGKELDGRGYIKA